MILQKDDLQFILTNEIQIAAFQRAGFTEVDAPEIDPEIQKEINRIKKMNQEQLVDFAKEKEISLEGITGKANIQTKILETLNLV